MLTQSTLIRNSKSTLHLWLLSKLFFSESACTAEDGIGKLSNFQVLGLDGTVLDDPNDPRVDDRFFHSSFEFTKNEFKASQFWFLDMVLVLSKKGFGYVTSKTYNPYLKRIKKTLTISKWM